MGHILIIEDEMLVAMHLETLMNDLGHGSVDLAATEEEALHCAAENRPCLILSDVKLAEGSGPAAVSAIQGECGPVPVIYITGNPEVCDKHADNVAVLTKPVQERMLAETVRSFLNAR